MENLNKIYPIKINRLVDWKTLLNSAKDLFFNLLPLAKPVCLIGLTAVFLLVVQIILVGVFDRWSGVSPKTSLLGSSLFYVTIFTGLALLGGLKRKEISEVVAKNFKAQPLCKILIIKSKER